MLDHVFLPAGSCRRLKILTVAAFKRSSLAPLFKSRAPLTFNSGRVNFAARLPKGHQRVHWDDRVHIIESEVLKAVHVAVYIGFWHIKSGLRSRL